MLRSFEPGARRRDAQALALDSTRALCAGIGNPTGGAWIVGRRGSASGAPLVVADWQLAPSVPALFYEVELEGGGLGVLGATLPGSPIFWLGRTSRLAFASVPAGAPIADLFIESLGERPGHYQNGALWSPLDEREEIFRYTRSRRRAARGEAHAALDAPRAADRVARGRSRGRRARRDRCAAAGATARALAWTGAQPRRWAQLDAGPVASRERGRRRLGPREPPRARARDRLCGSSRGGEGRRSPAGCPIAHFRRASCRCRGGCAASIGATASRSRPCRRCASVRGARPYVVAADQPWSSGSELGEVEFLWRPGERAARIEGELDRRLRRGAIDLRGAAEMLADHGHAPLAGRRPRSLLALARRAGPLEIEAEEIAQILEHWDGGTGPNSAGRRSLSSRDRSADRERPARVLRDGALRALCQRPPCPRPGRDRAARAADRRARAARRLDRRGPRGGGVAPESARGLGGDQHRLGSGARAMGMGRAPSACVSARSRRSA